MNRRDDTRIILCGLIVYPLEEWMTKIIIKIYEYIKLSIKYALMSRIDDQLSTIIDEVLNYLCVFETAGFG